MPTAAEIISLYADPVTNVGTAYLHVTTKVRKEMFLRYNNKVTRGGRVYEYQWENMKGGIWKIIGLKTCTA
jgi:hypothetical protein